MKRSFQSGFSSSSSSSQDARGVDRELVVNFACFVTCMSNNNDHSSSDPGNAIINMKIQGVDLDCVSVAVNKNHAIEFYLECGCVPLTKLLRSFEEMGLFCVSIFTFGPRPRSNGAPEALARIQYRVLKCGFKGYVKGIPSVDMSLDFDIRDVLTNWVKFTSDQIDSMMLADGSRPCEIVEWCVVLFSGDTSVLETRLRRLTLKSGAFRQYYIKGFECMRMPKAARIYMEIEPIVKTILLRCLTSEFGNGVEIMTFPPNQQFRALSYVSELRGILIEHGNLSVVDVPSKSPVSCIITRFTQNDLAIWECVVNEAAPLHWSVYERDAELVRLRAEVAALQMENSLIRDESSHYSQQCARFLSALDELKVDRERLRSELDAVNMIQSSESVSWGEWESTRSALEEKEKCIVQLKKQLRESQIQIQRLQRGELVSDDQGLWFCVEGSDNSTNGLGAKVKLLEQRLKSEFEGGLVFDEERGKNVETEGKTWTLVKWQARELDVYRNAYGSVSIRDHFDELDFSAEVPA